MAVFEPPGYFVIPVLRLFPLSDLAACSAGLGSGIFPLSESVPTEDGRRTTRLPVQAGFKERERPGF